MKVLVTGGAGYIGSITARKLQGAGHEVTILDNFSTGHRWAVEGFPLIEVDLCDREALLTTLQSHSFDAIVHFAAKSLVAESQKNPILYWQNNVGGSSNLIEAALQMECERFVFSSTAAVYGAPDCDLITEEQPTNPINVYGETKLAVEKMLKATSMSSGSMSAICLRYFNAAGALVDGSLGEWHEPETHLIPNVLRAASGEAPALTIFGTDYPTPDGTCVRDYIHVEDLADAHIKAVETQNMGGGDFEAVNLGTERGTSEREVYLACQEIVDSDIPVTYAERRPGDPPKLVAAAHKAHHLLGWRPAHMHISDAVRAAWHWEQVRCSKGIK